MTISELWENETKYWIASNQKLFGITPINEDDDFDTIQKSLEDDCNKYWNTKKPCKLAKYLNNGILNKQAHLQEPNSYVLKLNFFNMCIDVLGSYSGKLYKVCAIPTPCDDLSWIINRSHYIPRVTATRDYDIVRKEDFENINGNSWSYNIREDKFKCKIENAQYKFEPTIEEIYNNHLSIRSKYFLEAVLKKPLTIDNFKEGLKKLPIFESNSIYNYKFNRLEYFEDIIINSGKYAKPLSTNILGINKLIGGKAKIYTNSGKRLEGYLVRAERRNNKIFNLENFRTCCNIYNTNNTNVSGYTKKGQIKAKASNFQPAFTYTDTNGFFDSFKTVTSKSAGRQRLLLDNIVMKYGMLWVVDEKGEMHNMYEFIDMPPKSRLSCLSEAPFCNNDKPKRIMMNAKMTSQSVALEGESDEFTHRILARVGFTDLEGYTFADSIVISESFAKRLRTYYSDLLYLSTDSNLFATLTNNPTFDLETLKQIWATKNEAILSGYENIKIEKIDYFNKNQAKILITWEIPFRLGDKITNLHGAKGTVGKIIPDDKMPKLTKKVGNMEAGPLEIIISGFSTIRRGSLGQIFEAWANASGIEYNKGDDFISKMINKYATQMQKYSENSIVEYNGDSVIVPVGIINIMRLYHHASTKVSCSSADYAYKRTLRLGEMEKLNLVANDCPNILKELGIRSVTKYVGSHRLINEMENERKLPTNTHLSLTFAEIVKSIGYNISINGKNLINTDYTSLSDLDIEVLNMLMKGDTDNGNENGNENED